MRKGNLSFMLILVIFIFFMLNCTGPAQQNNGGDTEIVKYEPVDFSKTNKQKIFVHYTPWYETKEYSGEWSWHWTMNNCNPDIILPNGQRQIASHFYPLIGAYDTSDPDLLEYHVILMKLSGIDGAVIEWYGIHDVYDSLSINNNAKLLLEYLEMAGIDFVMCYEDRNIEIALNNGLIATKEQGLNEDMEYLKNNYFTSPNYYKINNREIILNFGPFYIKDYSVWTNSFVHTGIDPIYLPLPNFYPNPGQYTQISGEFYWISTKQLEEGLTEEDILNTPAYADQSLQYLIDWYGKILSDNKDFIVGSAYPGFYDYWNEGGAWASYGAVPYNDKKTFIDCLNLTAVYNPDIVQVATWNDFQEGTQIEPTVEDGYKYLTTLQNFTGNNLTQTELEMAKKIYDLRKGNKTNINMQNKLTNIFYLIVSNQLNKAKEELENIQ